ncbi:MAG: hypothetical protein DMG90_08710 [Acidobacteria bacterium]|nr:MAG: hypothetical protein DMG90_08710 [Acidobacteriota bacterium]
MMPGLTLRRLRVVLLIGLLVFCFSSSSRSSTADKGSTTYDSTLYVGSETCKTCHEDIYNKFETTPHWKTTFTKKGPQWQGCEACHGPGKEHVEGGGDKSKIFVFEGKTAEQVSKRCLGCHEYGEEHANFDRSQHNLNDVSCISCHSPHHAKEKQFLLVNKQPELCYGCHTDIKQDFNRPFRHRVEQGLIQCSDCHNQHGGFLTRQVRATASQDQVCFKFRTRAG